MLRYRAGPLFRRSPLFSTSDGVSVHRLLGPSAHSTKLAAQDFSTYVGEPLDFNGTAAISPQASGSRRTNSRRDNTPQPRSLLSQILRAGLASEAASGGVWAGQRAVLGSRPDLQAAAEEEERLRVALQELAPQYRVRPSLLTPLLSAAGYGLGAAAALAPPQLSAAIAGAVQEGLTEGFNDQLRALREAGLAEEAGQLREALKALRDQQRAPPDAPKAPDLSSLQRMQELSVSEGLAALVKAACKGVFSASARL